MSYLLTMVFGDVGPDIRWVSNERGVAGDRCWECYDPVGANGGSASPADVREKESPMGHRHGKYWMPAECDVSIRPGWFWHEDENTEVKGLDQLVGLYYRSVGRANLLLNVPPIAMACCFRKISRRLRDSVRYRRATFARNLASGAKTVASNVRGALGPQNLLDGRSDSYWAAEDPIRECEFTFEFAREASFNVDSHLRSDSLRPARRRHRGRTAGAEAHGSLWPQRATSDRAG